MSFSPLTSDRVKAFLSLNTWTEVNLISNTPTDSGVYIATTEEKEKKREKDSETILIQSSSYEKIKEFKALEIVAVEINRKWYRGKLISFNEFQDDDTRIELVDIGSFHQTKLQNVFILPYYLMYEPLALPIKFKNFTPETKKLKIRPLLSESMLHVGAVTVDVHLNHLGSNNIQNGHKEVIKKNIKFDCDSSVTSIQSMTNGQSYIPSSILSDGSRKGGYENQKKSYNVPYLKNGDSCFITFFNGSSVYAVKAVKSISDNSFKMHDSYIISKTVESTDQVLKFHPRLGDIVKVFSKPKKTFYRARIIKTLNEEWYDVINIDLGGIEKVPSSCIYELAEELQEKPGLAVEISIDGLLHSEGNKEITNLLEKFIKEKKVFLMEFDERAKNYLNIKLKEENGSYLNLNYLKNCLSMENHSEKTQELNRVNNTQNIPISLNDEHITNGHQELISSTKCNSENICDEYSVGNSKDIVKNVINKTKKRLIDDFDNVALANGDLCVISFFKNFDNIYVCKAVKNDDSQYDSHNTNIVLKTMSSSDKKIKEILVVGDIVKVFSTEFLDLFRAEILSIESNGSFLVSYIDFGNTEIVQPSDIFELSNELLDKETKLPVRVSIKVPSNSKETAEIDKLFKELIDNIIVLSIEFNEKSTNGLENVTFKYLESGKSVNDEILKLLPTVKIPIKSGDNCIITHCKDFDSIYVSKGHLSENSDFLNSVICSTDRKLKTNPLLGDIVKVLSPTFEDFYRAKILSVENNSDFNVFYIDFGNTEVVQSNNIFELSDDFKIKPELAIKIGIQIPSNIKLNEQIRAMLKHFEDDVIELSIEFDETSEDCLQYCILKVISSGLNVNEEIIKLFPTQSLSSVENLDAKVKKPSNSQKVGSIKPLRNREAVFVTYFDNFSAIFVRKVSEDEHFTTVVENVCNEESKNNMTNIQIGDIVKVPYDGMMSRALILDKKDQDHFFVSFIDFGNEETVHINQIFELSEELKKIPNCCIQIGMKRSFEIGQLEIVKDYLKQFEDKELLIIEYDEENPNGLNEASLKKTNNIDIFDELCKIVDKPMYIKEESIKNSENTENELLSNLSEIERMSSIELKSGDTVFCCNFEDFDNLFLCKGSKNNTQPDNFNVIVDSSKLKDLKVRKNTKFDDVVWVKFEENIVRAKVLTIIEKMYIVFLMDIGKSISVSADNIFEMPNNLKLIPGFAIKVGLKRPHSLETSSVVKDYFHKLWYVKPVPLTMICDEDNFNYLNEVNLKKLSDGRDVIDDLFEICGKSNNVPNQQKQIGDVKKNSNNQHFLIGDNVEFLSGNNIDNICIRSIKLYTSYKHILEQLKEEKIDNLKTIIPRPQEIVAVFSPRNNGIHRAKIIGQNDDGSSRCALIDIGLIDFVKAKQIFALPSYASINKVPLLTRKVTLADLTKTPNCNNTILYLSSKTGQTFVLEYNKNAELWYKQVVLKNLLSGKSMNEEIRELSVSTTDTSKSQQRRLERKIVVNEIKEIKMEKAHHPIKSGSFVNIVHFESFNTIYVRDASYEYLEMFSEFNKKMKKYYRHNSNLRVKELVCAGDKVCVNTTLNQVMHCRALVLEKIGNEYNVFNVDYGNKELVKSNDIFELPEELGKLSYFAVHVQLQNMPQLTTKNEYQVIKDFFKKKIIWNNTQLILEFNEYNPKGLNDVIFKSEYTKKDIADDLRNLLNAPPLNIKTGQATENPSSSTATKYPSPYPARRHINASKN